MWFYLFKLIGTNFKGRNLRRNPLREVDTALDTQDSSDRQPTESRASKFKSFAQMASRDDSIFNFENLEDKGFRQLYSDVLDKLDIVTDCKLTTKSYINQYI